MTVTVSAYVVQDYVATLRQKVVKLEAMAARNSSDKVISAQVCTPGLSVLFTTCLSSGDWAHS